MKGFGQLGWRTRAAVTLAIGVFLPSVAFAQAVGKSAGKITAQIPVSSVVRGTKSFEAAKDLPVNWNDVVRTERGGRVRLRLDDGSILNVGSQSSMRIQQHDSAAQRTSLELAYGRMRASVVRISNPGGNFQVRTSAAVAGVVGTDEYLEATDIVTTVIALGGGQVTVNSTDPRFTETILLNPGEAATLVAGRAPGPKRAATSDELVKAVQETEVDSVVQLNPNRTLAGRTFAATIQGRGLGNTTGITSPISGISVQLTGTASGNQLPVSVQVAANVAPGTYNLAVERPEGPALASLVVTTEEAMQQAAAATAQAIELPPSQSLSAIRGAKFSLDASNTRTPAGTQIISTQWSVLNTSLSSNNATFMVNTSLLSPGNYTIQLQVVNDAGQSALQQFPLVVNAGTQPAEIVQRIAIAYESLQPDRFLSEFDQQKFRNFAGFEAAIQDSFRNQLESMRVFQRPVNCTTLEEQDQAVCQADFELRFTQKNQPTQLLDPQGNPVPPGVTPPPGSTLGKRVQVGFERITLRYERGDAGWKVTDYGAIVTCPGGASTTGLNVGSCVIAAGSPVTPSFQISNLQVFSPDLPLGGSVGGTFDVVPLGGFSGTINFSAQGQVGGQNVTVQFSPNPSGAPGTVSFFVTAPSTPPLNFSGPLPFTLVITGTDSTGGITASGNVAMVLQPNFTLNILPSTTSSTPVAVTHNSTFNIDAQVIPGTGFSGTVFVDFPNLPPGFVATPGNVSIGGTTRFPIQVDSAAVPGPAIVTVRATVGTGLVKTVAVFVDVISDFSIVVTPATSNANPAQVNANRTLNLSVQVVPVLGFAGNVLIDFPGLPAGFGGTPATLPAGSTGGFGIFVNATTPQGLYTITVRGSVGGSSPKTVTVFVQVLVALIPITSGPSRDVTQTTSGKSQTSTSTNSPTNSPGEIAPDSREKISSSTELPPANLRVVAGAGSLQSLQAGQSTEAVIYGENLQDVKSVQVSGSGITAEVLEAQPGELRVRFTVAASAAAGARLLSVQTLNARTTTTLEIAPRNRALLMEGPESEPPLKGRRVPADANPNAVETAGALADLVVRREDITVTPSSPKAGETVTFRVRVSNEGERAVENGVLEFVIDGAGISQRENFSLGPQQSQTFTFEWVAGGRGRLAPRVALDPDNTVAESNRANNRVALPAFVLSEALPAQPVVRKATAVREQMQIRLAPGACVGIRLSTAREVDCESGDIAIRATPAGESATLEADGIQSLGIISLDAIRQPPSGGSSRSAALAPNTRYVVEIGQRHYALRVVQVRALRATRRPPPEALRTPSAKGADVDVLAGGGPALLIVLQWSALP